MRAREGVKEWESEERRDSWENRMGGGGHSCPEPISPSPFLSQYDSIIFLVFISDIFTVCVDIKTTFLEKYVQYFCG
jgi:hypothetical protein